MTATGLPRAACPLIMAAGFHPVPAGGHRTPPGGAGLAVVDQEQAALGVRARAQPPGALPCEGVPAEDGTDSQLAFRWDGEGPADRAVRDRREQRGALLDRGQYVRRLLAANDRLEQ